MPRFLVAVIAFLGGCSFDARYSEGVPCTDDRCPSGLVCHLDRCVSMIPIDMMIDVPPPEGPPPALTCADPGVFPVTGGTVTATTVGATSKMSSQCPAGLPNNGPDRVYKIMMNGTQQLRVSIVGMRKAYVLTSPCVESPNTPACVGGTRATDGNPILVTLPAGPAFVVVDDENAGLSSSYTLTLTPM